MLGAAEVVGSASAVVGWADAMTLMPGVAAGAVASGASDIFALGAATGEGLSDGAAIVVCGGSATDEAGAAIAGGEGVSSCTAGRADAGA